MEDDLKYRTYCIVLHIFKVAPTPVLSISGNTRVDYCRTCKIRANSTTPKPVVVVILCHSMMCHALKNSVSTSAEKSKYSYTARPLNADYSVVYRLLFEGENNIFG